MVSTAAHPRSRGENTGEIENAVKEAGSSPLARGKPIPPYSLNRTIGLIPARAGKTKPSNQRHKPTWAHPRSRGENTQSCTFHTLQLGSSPLARGKPYTYA